MMRNWMRAMTALWLISAQPALAGPSEQADTPPVRTNIVYGSYSGLALLMDIYAPRQGNGRAILYIPGSGFQAPVSMEPYGIKDAAQTSLTVAPFVAQGFTVFVINHRAAPRFTYPAPFEDVQRASRFIRAHAADYGISPKWLGVLGASSGGNLALLLATRGEGQESPPSSSPGMTPQCVVAVMPPTDLLALGQQGIGVALVTQYMGMVAPFPEESAISDYAERLATYQAASPITHLRAGTTGRFLLIHGDADQLVPLDQSMGFIEKAKILGVKAELWTMHGVGHKFAAPYPTGSAQWMQNCAEETGAWVSVM